MFSTLHSIIKELYSYSIMNHGLSKMAFILEVQKIIFDYFDFFNWNVYNILLRHC